MKHLWPILLTLLLVACKPERCDTPFGNGGSIDLTMEEFSNLYNHVGGTLVISCGYKGVLVRCSGFGEYTAFECACPNDHDVRLLPDDNREAMILTCPTCSSRFELVNGNPLEGSVTPCPLYQYHTAYDGRMLSIY